MFSWVSPFYLEAVPIGRWCSELMKCNETCSSWLISQWRGSSNDTGKRVLFLLWAQALDSFPQLWGCAPRKIPEKPPSGPRANKIFFYKGKGTKAWTLASSCAGVTVGAQRPWLIRASTVPWGATPNSVGIKGWPHPGQAGQSPCCVSLKTSLRILRSERPLLPNTKNI